MISFKRIRFRQAVPFGLTSVLLMSCVSNKKLVYLQNDDFKGDLTYYEIVNEHKPIYEEYRLKGNDVVALKIASVTPSEFNFVKEYQEQLGVLRELSQYEQNNFVRDRGAGQGLSTGRQVDASISGLGSGTSQFLADQWLHGLVLDSLGQLDLPKIGNLKLSGLTIREAEGLVGRSLTGYFETPIVRIQLLSFQFSIFGEVEKEGRYTSYDPKTSIFDAIALGGNLTEFADRARIKLVRHSNGTAQVIHINTLDEDLLDSPYFYMKPSDQLIVPPLKAKEAKEYIIPNLTFVLAFATTVIGLIILFR